MQQPNHRVSGSSPAHAQPCVLASFDRLSLVNAASVVLLLVSLMIFLALDHPGTATGTTPRAAQAAEAAQPAGSVALVAAGEAQASVPWPSVLQQPGLGSQSATGSTSVSAPASALAADGIPQTALEAYQGAVAWVAQVDPGCGISWPLLAAIGRVESDHGRFAGAVLHTDGTSTPKIIGIPLDGHGTALILDTDHGRLDGDTVYDRAVGPMQFIPSTWASYGVDANGDGIADPFNIFDAAAAAAHYLCTAGGDLTTIAGQTRAVLAYNHSAAYLAMVLGLEQIYATGQPGLIIPTSDSPTGSRAPGTTGPGTPPVNPAPTPSARPTIGRSSTPAPSRPGTPSTSPISACPPSAGPITDPPSNPGSDTPTASPTDSTTSSTDPPSGSPSSGSAVPSGCPQPTDTTTPASPTATSPTS
jgi:membrane-bound lytic murein transglycosylase B